MSRRLILWGLLAIWLILFSLSIIMPRITPSTDFGFTAGLNRITLFFGYQIGAAFCGLILLITARDEPHPTLRWLARGPAIVALCLVVATIGGAIWASDNRLSANGNDPSPASSQTAYQLAEPTTQTQ